MWNTLCSRRFALWSLLALLLPLTLSALLPSELTLPELEWAELERQSPLYYALASRLATPYLVQTPFFAAVSLLLFLSTGACTLQRVLGGLKGKNADFCREKSFSCARESTLSLSPERSVERIAALLQGRRWQQSSQSSPDSLLLSAEKGRSGVWGSIVFHIGLLACFLAAPVTYLTALSGQLLLTEGVALSLQEEVVLGRGSLAELPEATVSVHDLSGLYFKGRFKSHFGGTLKLSEGASVRELPFEVNRPVQYRGLQFSLHQFGYAPRLVLEPAEGPPLDLFLNLRHPKEGDYFELGQGVRALVLFFPDFVREGGKIGSRSEEPANPVTMVRLYRGEREIGKGLFRPGESAQIAGYRVSIPEYRRWANLVLSRDAGVSFALCGFVLCVAGLLVRFLSNERLLEFELKRQGEGSLLRIKGYSRYYPAFLEQEVQLLAQKLTNDEAP